MDNQHAIPIIRSIQLIFHSNKASKCFQQAQKQEYSSRNKDEYDSIFLKNFLFSGELFKGKIIRRSMQTERELFLFKYPLHEISINMEQILLHIQEGISLTMIILHYQQYKNCFYNIFPDNNEEQNYLRQLNTIRKLSLKPWQLEKLPSLLQFVSPSFRMEGLKVDFGIGLEQIISRTQHVPEDRKKQISERIKKFPKNLELIKSRSKMQKFDLSPEARRIKSIYHRLKNHRLCLPRLRKIANSLKN